MYYFLLSYGCLVFYAAKLLISVYGYISVYGRALKCGCISNYRIGLYFELQNRVVFLISEYGWFQSPSCQGAKSPSSGVGGELPHMRAPTRVRMRESHGGWTVRTWQLGDFASELTAKILAQKD